MSDNSPIMPPTGEDDFKGAQRVFEEFFTSYKDTLTALEKYLDKIMAKTEPVFAEAYKPWRDAVHDLLRGVHLLAKNIPLPDPESFLDALRTFSFEGAIQFLRDLCASCKIALQPNWADIFHKQIDTLLFAFAILSRKNQQEQSPAR